MSVLKAGDRLASVDRGETGERRTDDAKVFVETVSDEDASEVHEHS